MRRILPLVALVFVLWPAGPRADDKPPPHPEPPARVETRHTITLAGRRIDYRAIAETIGLSDAQGAPTASIYTVAYLADAAPGALRPLAFVFNGGPGAASVFLHLGALGPRIMATPGDGSLPAPPVRLVDNPSSWLAFTDLVFVDPVGTGFSQSAGKDGKGEDSHKPFWSVRGDLDAMSEVVRLWLTRHERWGVPVYLVGESYGGFRAAALAQGLADKVGLTVSGVVLISPALDPRLLHGGVAALLPPAFVLPSYAEAAAESAGTPLDAEQRAAAEDFALGGYLEGLAAMQGVPPPGDKFIARVAALIGLKDEIVRRERGRVPVETFVRELRRDRQQRLSIYDATVARATRGNPYSDEAGDPVLDPATAAFTAAFNTYAPDALGYHTELPYKVLAHDVSRHWDWDAAGHGEGGLGMALTGLEQALLTHPQTRVLIVNGRSDLVTPYLASRWLVDQLSLPEAVRRSIRIEVEDGGHMMYLRRDSLAALSAAAESLFAP